ncbi:hypothetical protein BKA70DRAFT_1272878 [Coprinopsis sp. MPI-PUGE-AT-0042]|nr:hypothetical protein BKA70DRAFT_1272878 [Coprinopsis sp. MPI-PUGE-AT-0042]
MVDIPTQMPSDNDNLFTILKRSGIHLTEIKSGGICKPLLQYLLSYRNTVQQLTLNVSLSTANQRLAEDLDKVLLNHQSSLRELSISAPLDEGWALGENNKDMLLVSLPVLQSLKIPVFMDSGGSLGERIIWYKLCLDRVVDRTRFPLLRWLHIDCMVDKIPKYSGFRTPPRCGAGAFVNRQRRYAEALRRLQSYRFNIDNSGARGGAMAQLPLLNICNLDAHSTYCEGVVGGLGLGGQRRSRR